MHILTQKLLQRLNDIKPHMDLSLPKPVHGLIDLHNWAEILALYEGLSDEHSKQTFLNLILYRITHLAVSIETATDIYSLYPKQTWLELVKAAQNMPGIKGDYAIDRIETWILKGYEYKDCKAMTGDVVIDAGAFTGNTALYFSKCVGKNGKVFSFEPMLETFNILKENTNNLMQVQAINAGLSNKDEQILTAAQNDCGASIFKQGDTPIKVRSLDSFVQEQNLNRLDFVKFDIEGAEMQALEGAINSIKRFTPKMALCIYHKPTDIFNIYKRVLEYNPNYNFYIKHCSNVLWETVLFCMPKSDASIYHDCTNTYAEDIILAHALRNFFKSTQNLALQLAVETNKNNVLSEQLSQMMQKTKNI